MKNVFKLCILILVVFVVGLTLDIVGYQIGNITMAKVGINIMSFGIPLSMTIAVFVSMIMLFTGKWSFNDNKPKDGKSLSEEKSVTAESEAEKIGDINSSYGYDSQMKLAEYQVDQTAKIYRNTNKRGRVFGWLFFGFLMLSFIMIIVFAFFGNMIGVFVCLGLFAGTIIISLIVKVILEKTSMSQRIDPDKYNYTTATVKACVLSSMGSTGGGRHNSTTRVTSVTYRIILDVEGQEYNAYSHDVYEEGERIEVAVKRNGRGVAKIIEKTPEQISAEIEKDLAERNARLQQLEREYARFNAQDGGDTEEDDKD
ncbi:MAG: hypothetical protein K2N14_00315 [Clostridia bacterium]|nr:hypothetical protein [Clostridia bacterium]